MSLHVIVGAGPVGSGTARLLADAGEQVRVITRHGSGPTHPSIERIAADAADAPRLAELTTGAVALYNCVNPPYHRWPQEWPPIANSMLRAAERSGAVLAIAGNLYGYGPVAGRMTEATPLASRGTKGRVRVRMWHDALAAHEAGRVRATEVRASDYIEANGVLAMVGDRLRAGRTVYLPAPLDVPHSFTAIMDVARALVTVARDERAWGQAWHVPSNPPMTMRELATRYATVAGAPAPRLREIPYWALWSLGVFNPFVRGLRETRYQFNRPFILDSAHTEQTFDLHPTPVDEVLRRMLGAA